MYKFSLIYKIIPLGGKVGQLTVVRGRECFVGLYIISLCPEPSEIKIGDTWKRIHVYSYFTEPKK